MQYARLDFLFTVIIQSAGVMMLLLNRVYLSILSDFTWTFTDDDKWKLPLETFTSKKQGSNIGQYKAKRVR